MVSGLVYAPEASAAWDPLQFSQTLEQAQSDYQAAAYTDALQRYLTLDKELVDALAAGEIPEEQKERALAALNVIRYQVVRCHQHLNQCKEAHQAFLVFGDFDKLDAELRTKLQVRFAEVHVCLAEEANSSGDLSMAIAEVEEAKRLAQLVIPDETTDPKLIEVLDSNEQKSNTITDSVTVHINGVVRDKLAQDDCDGAWSDIRWAKTELHLDTKQLEDAATTQCSVTGWSSYVPFALMGTGVVLGLTALVIEAVNSGDVSELDDARDACLGGLTSHCDRALRLVDDIESQRTTSVVLLALGTTALGAGLVWWILEDDDTDQSTFLLLPTTQGASVSYRMTW